MDQSFSTQEIAQFREDTPGCSNVIHLNNAGASLMPQPVIQAISEHIVLEGNIGGYEAAGLREDAISGFYTAAAKLLNTKPASIAFTANATDAYTRALSSVPFQKGDIILTSKDDYISNQINFLSLVKRFGIVIKRIENLPGGGVDLNDLDEQLKEYHPKLLSVTHIPTNSGLVQPAEEIGAIVKKYDTIYLLDACQSAGQKELNVEKLHCDFLSVTSRKFLRGPRGAGFLYISDKTLNRGLEPLFIDMRGAEWVEKDIYIPRKDATRFEDWEFAHALLLGTKVSIEYCLNIGIERIWERIQYLAAYTREKLRQINALRLLDEGPELCSIITFTIPGFEAEVIKNELGKKKINVVTSYRNFAVIDFDKKGVKWAIRVSPHYFNTESEIDIFLEQLISLIDKKR
ncbi:MAG: aminotransferase class V-fold PLP-dependent enzyme [Bacteroidota bacterium]|nr:aminotransferase class V-fold PLP-dependent enzyme [Bacteroidota bacterium]